VVHRGPVERRVRVAARDAGRQAGETGRVPRQVQQRDPGPGNRGQPPLDRIVEREDAGRGHAGQRGAGDDLRERADLDEPVHGMTVTDLG
jgi:hypothetical protein